MHVHDHERVCVRTYVSVAELFLVLTVVVSSCSTSSLFSLSDCLLLCVCVCALREWVVRERVEAGKTCGVRPVLLMQDDF